MELMTPVHKEATVKHVKRWGGWWAGVVLLVGVVGFVASQQIPVLLFKVSQVCIGVGLAYWTDRTMFSNAPEIHCDMPSDAIGAARLIARAIIVLGIVVGVTIGI